MSTDNKKLERELQNFIKDTIRSQGGYFSQLHPGLGSDLGIPDLLIGVDSVGILPAEIKIGSIEGKELTSSKVRLSQEMWHQKVDDHGYFSCFLIGVPTIIGKKKSWDIYAVPGSYANIINDGIKVGYHAYKISNSDLVLSLSNFSKDHC